jgi:putative component of toxin-antitoxin plasmid stabilization module
VYYSIRNRNTVVLLLAGGDKGDQNKEIRKAIRLNKEIKDEDL